MAEKKKTRETGKKLTDARGNVMFQEQKNEARGRLDRQDL